MYFLQKFMITALAAGALIAAPSAALASNAQPAMGSTVHAASVPRVAAIRGVVVPDFAREKCTTDHTSGNVTTCVRLVSHGTNFLARASATVHRSARRLKECLRTPFGTFCNRNFVLVGRGQTLRVTASGNRPAPNGTYCATTYRQGTSHNVGHVCVTKG